MLRIVKSRLLKAYSVRYQHFTLNSERCIYTRELAFFSLGFPLVIGRPVFLLYQHSCSVRTH